MSAAGSFGRNLGLLALRAGVGATLVAHGYPKLFGGPDQRPPEWMARAFGPNYEGAVQAGGTEATSQMFGGMGLPSPKAAAMAAGVAEFGGGTAILLGFRSRPAALLALTNMAVAIRKAHWRNGFYGEGGFEFPLLLGVGAGAIALAGPGAIALDRVFR